MSRIWKELGLVLTFAEKERLMENFILFQYLKEWLKGMDALSSQGATWTRQGAAGCKFH